MMNQLIEINLLSHPYPQPSRTQLLENDKHQQNLVAIHVQQLFFFFLIILISHKAFNLN